MRICVNCRTENPEDAVMCSGCGMSLRRASVGELVREGVTVTNDGPTAIQSRTDLAGQEDTPSVVRVTQRTPSPVIHLAAPAAAAGATLVVFATLGGLEFIYGGGRTPMLKAIFEPGAVSAFGVDMSARLMLMCALQWVQYFSFMWLASALVIFVVGWARGRGHHD